MAPVCFPGPSPGPTTLTEPTDAARSRRPGAPGRNRYAYLRSDGTFDIVLGSLVAGLAAYAYQFLGGRVLGASGFAPIGALLTAHFLAFVVVLLPIEQFVIRRITLGARRRVVPARALLLAIGTALLAAAGVWGTADDYFAGDVTFVGFVVATVLLHLGFTVGRGYLAGFRRFREYGIASGGASVLRLVLAVGAAVLMPTIDGFAWAHVLGPLVILAFLPLRAPRRVRTGSRGPLAAEEVATVDERGLLTGLVLSSAASQALLLAGPLVAGALGADSVEFSVLYATLLLARAPLTFGYNLIARVLPPFTEMAAKGERRELRAWARGMGVASAFLAVLAAGAGAAVGPVVVTVAFGADFAPGRPLAAAAAAGVALAGGGLFIGQVLVARGHPARLAGAWTLAVFAAAASLLLPLEDPALRVVVAFLVGEAVALMSLTAGALMRDRAEGDVSHGYLVVKRSLDIGVSLILLVLLAPAILLAALAVRIDSRGPAFFRQLRTGRHGEEFWLIKLRTMVIDHDEEVFRQHLRRLRETAGDDAYTIRIEDDPRITRVGRLLRRWSLDELPNLWNVLKGHMSLVGPRPLVPDEAAIIGLDHDRFLVKPGVTGLAQVEGRDTLSMAQRTALDERYVRERSLALDLRILLRTVVAVVSTPGDEDR